MVWVAKETSTAVSLDAVWIGAGAVLLAAVIAGVVAIVGLKATLKAERERLNRQLEHDRELTDLAELRTMLDSMMGDVLALHEAYVHRDQQSRGTVARRSPYI